MSIGAKIGRLAGLILVTTFCGAVMLASGMGLWGGSDDTDDQQPTVAELPPSPVRIRHVTAQQIEITDTYSGMLKPWERYQLGFDLAGRIQSLGENVDGQTLDDGDVVRAGQTLAVLDHRHLAAREREAAAMLRRAKDEHERALELFQVNQQAIRQGTLLQRETDFEVAKAQHEMAAKTLDDATLTAKVDGVLSRRLINVGEPVLPQQAAFEIVQVDRLLLTVGVPESRVRALVDRQREVERLRELRPDAAFKVHIQLSGRNSLGRPLGNVDGAVRTISQTADDASGLFEVEVAVDNRDRLLRPGQIGIARIVVARVPGFRLPAAAAVVRNDAMALFYAVRKDSSGPQPPPQASDQMLARLLPLAEGDYLEQQRDLIILKLPAEARNVITRGQHRLVDGSPIVAAQVTIEAADSPSGTAPDLPAGPAPGSTGGQAP